MKKTIILLTALSASVALAASCSKKCGDNIRYNPRTHFCYENRAVHERCGGKEYNPERQFCAGDSIVDKCGGKEYSPQRQFCAGDSVVGKCGGNEYNPKRQFCDPRDNNVYRYTKIGEQTWMAENLNFKTDSSYCYRNADSNCAKYGRLYNWETAKNVCPSGWHLPCRGEWDRLIADVGGVRNNYAARSKVRPMCCYDEFAGKKLKSTSGWIAYNGVSGTDEFGFSALPGGMLYPPSRPDSYTDRGRVGSWWSASEDEMLFAYCPMIFYDDDGVFAYPVPKKNGHSVRCVRD